MKNHFYVAAGVALFVGFWVFIEVNGALQQQSEDFLKTLDVATKTAFDEGFQNGKLAKDGE
jgi:hypothetical protein